MKFKNAKMTTVNAKNPFPKMKVGSDAAMIFPAFVVKDNKYLKLKLLINYIF